MRMAPPPLSRRGRLLAPCRAAAAMTAGANQAVTLSTIAWIGSFDPWAASTIQSPIPILPLPKSLQHIPYVCWSGTVRLRARDTYDFMHVWRLATAARAMGIIGSEK